MDSAIRLLADLEHRIGKAGFTTAQVCRRAGISQAQVSRWRSGVYEPRISGLQKLEDAFEALKRDELL